MHSSFLHSKKHRNVKTQILKKQLLNSAITSMEDKVTKLHLNFSYKIKAAMYPLYFCKSLSTLGKWFHGPNLGQVG